MDYEAGTIYEICYLEIHKAENIIEIDRKINQKTHKTQYYGTRSH